MTAPVRSKVEAASGREALEARYARGESALFVPLAELARREGRLREAGELLERGLEAWPERVSAWVQLARLRAQEGQMDEAMRHYRHVLESLDAHNLPALRALSASSLATGELEGARRHLELWSAVDPEDPELGDLLEELDALGGIEASPPPARAPGLTELGLAELEPAYLGSPSPADAAAWEGGGSGRARDERRG